MQLQHAHSQKPPSAWLRMRLEELEHLSGKLDALEARSAPFFHRLGIYTDFEENRDTARSMRSKRMFMVVR